MPHDLIDNQSIKLIDAIRQALPGSAAAHFAVGYFFLSGLEAVADRLANVQELRLLIGNTTDRETIEQIAEGYRRLEEVQHDLDALAYPKKAEQAERVQGRRQPSARAWPPCRKATPRSSLSACWCG